MLKTIAPSSYDFGEPIAALIKSANGRLRGSDRGLLEKRAGSDILRIYDTLSFAPDEVPIHLIAMGATEKFGCNRNGDGFREQVLLDFHKTFEKFARFYRDHANKDPARSYGLVKAAFYNVPMARVELICALNANEAAARRNGGLVADRELQKLASGKDIPVSMACVLDPTYPVLTRDRGYVNISDVKTGDFVWTHDGQWRRVKQLNRRKYTGTAYTFTMNGLPLPLELTADHPMFAKVFAGSREAAAVKAKAGRYFRDAEVFETSPAGWTHAEHVGVGDRFFVRPITSYGADFAGIGDVRLAAVMGYYLAEGSCDETTVNFACNMADSLPRRLPGLVRSMYPGVTVDIAPKSNSAVGLAVLVYAAELCKFLGKYLGRSVENKVIPPEMFNASPEVKLAFLGAWLDGDGWLDKKGVHWSTSNRGLALQGRDLLLSIGIPASIYKIDHTKCPTSGYTGSGIEYTLNVSHLDAWALAAHSEKSAQFAPPKQLRTKPAALRRCPDGLYAVRVSGVTQREVVDQLTYNFEVETDESYSLGGLISHNCSVSHDICSYCGNKAKTRRDYCRGLDDGGLCKAGGLHRNIGRLVEVDGDAHSLHADNPDPRFFDISHVYRPADRIAYVLGKLEKAAGVEGIISGADLAEAFGLVLPYELRVAEDVPADCAKLMKLAYCLADVELQPADNRALAFDSSVHNGVFELPPRIRSSKVHVGQWLKASIDTRSLLSPEAFLHHICRLSPKQAADTAPLIRAQLPGIYGRLTKESDFADTVRRYACEPTYAVPQWIVETMRKSASTISIREPYLTHRVRLATVRGAELSPVDETAATKLAAAGGPTADLARGYAIYKLAFLAGIPETSEEFPAARELIALQNLCG